MMRRWLSLAGPLGCAAVSMACYSNTPIDTSVQPPANGEMIALDITDGGRVALAERLGTGVSQVEGRLRSATSQAYELQVYKVSFFRDADSRWNGERVTIDRAHVGKVYARTLSRGRTIAAAALVGGGVLTLIITRTLAGGGDEKRNPDDPPGPDQYRSPALHLNKSHSSRH